MTVRAVEKAQMSRTDNSVQEGVRKKENSDDDAETPPIFVGASGRLERLGSQDDSGDGQDVTLPPPTEAGVVLGTMTRTSTKSSWKPSPPPDGGWHAWGMALCMHLVIANTWGLVNSFGIFQTYYNATLGLPPSTVSWIGSTQVFLLFFVGTLAGRLTDSGYFRAVLLTGSVLQLVATFTAAQSGGRAFWTLFLSQGLCGGLANGLLFCPGMAVLSTYFARRRGLAIGVATCGTVTGGLLFPGLARALLPRKGFSWAMRSIGFVQAAFLVVANIFLRPRVMPPRKSGPLMEWRAFGEMQYAFFAMGSFFCFLGVYFAYFYAASFSTTVIGLDYTSSLNLFLVLNGVGFFGRLLSNFIADIPSVGGPLIVFVPIALLVGICLLSWTAVTTATGMYVWVVFYGLFAGGLQSLFPTGLSSLTTDLRKAGVRMGMVFTINSFAVLMGEPIAGAIVSATPGGTFYGAQVFAGVVVLIGAGLVAAASAAKASYAGRVRMLGLPINRQAAVEKAQC